MLIPLLEPQLAACDVQLPATDADCEANPPWYIRAPGSTTLPFYLHDHFRIVS